MAQSSYDVNSSIDAAKLRVSINAIGDKVPIENVKIYYEKSIN